MTRLSNVLDAVRLQALLSRLDPHHAATCPVEECVHHSRAPREAEPPRRPKPALRAA